MSTILSMLDERGSFGMSFVIRTEHGKLIVVDGGMTEDTGHLLEYIGGQRVAAWFLTHPHLDHITAFMDVAEFHRDEEGRSERGARLLSFPGSGVLPAL